MTSVRLCTTYEYVFLCVYIYVSCISAAALGVAVLLWLPLHCCRLLLPFVNVCRVTQFVAVAASDSSVFFLFIQTRFVFNVPLGSTVGCTASILVYVGYTTCLVSYILCKRGHARSQGGRHPATAKPPFCTL